MRWIHDRCSTFAIVVLAVVPVACGGGGSSSRSPSLTPVPQPVQPPALTGGCEASRESDGQRIGIEHLVGGFNFRLRCTSPDTLIAYSIARPADYSRAATFMSSPQFFGRNGVRVTPDIPVSGFFTPVRT